VLDLRKAAVEVAEVVKFEQWLRFYFTKGEGDDLTIEVPPERLAELKAASPLLFGLAELVNGQKLTYQSSCDNVCSYIAARFDGDIYPAGTVEKVFESRTYKLELYLFNLFVHTHEALLEQDYLPFGDWLSRFDAWRQTPEVKRYTDNLLASPSQVSTASH
jgi:hypothetical protein